MYIKLDCCFAVSITTEPSCINTSANSTVTFFCAARNANLFLWILNDSYVQNNVDLKNLYDTNDDVTSDPQSSVFKLWIPNEYRDLNESRIKCKAVDQNPGSDSIPVVSSEALLLIQGT